MMKKSLLLVVLFMAGVSVVFPKNVFAYNYGDYRSVTLVTKAWKALQDSDLEAVLAYTNKCVELYAETAQKMQASLTDYVTGTNDQIFEMWALNDVATAYFIQGEAYRKVEMFEEALEAYHKVINEYSFGQCWDPGGWFWKPSEASKEKIAMIESGSTLDFGDYKSVTLTTKAWEALAEKDLDSVHAYVNKCLELYQVKAKEMQDSLTEYPWENKDKIFSYWALNDVGTCLFIQGEALKNAGQQEEAKKTFRKLVDEFYYAQCWDPKGWFWKPAEAAQERLDELAN
jgi:tetratricopeptide (TPR) repeat protein